MSFHLCDIGTGPRHTVSIDTYVCPWCVGNRRWANGETCINCHGTGTTVSPEPGLDMSRDYLDGVEPEEAAPVPLPRPPAVMKQPCVDCAFRPGSPEEESRPGPDVPFFCHHGMHRVPGPEADYLPTATVDGMPLGALVCAGWWALATGNPLPEKDFHDPGGSDRHQDAPQ